MIEFDQKSTAMGRNKEELKKSIRATSAEFLSIVRRSCGAGQYASSLVDSTVWATVEYAPCHTMTKEETVKLGLEPAAFAVSWAVKLDADSKRLLDFTRVDPVRLFKLVVEMPNISLALKRRGTTVLTLRLPQSRESCYLGRCINGQPVSDEGPKQPPILVPIPKSEATHDAISFCILATTDVDAPPPSNLSPDGPDTISPTPLPHQSAKDDSMLTPLRRTFKRSGSELQSCAPAKSNTRITRGSSRHQPLLATPPASSSVPKARSSSSSRSQVYETKDGYVVKVLGIEIGKPFLEGSTAILVGTIEMFSSLNTWKTQKDRPLYLTLHEYTGHFPEHVHIPQRMGDWCTANAGKGGLCSSTYANLLRNGGRVEIPRPPPAKNARRARR
ncbi:hypothetical protein BOTBODRAFT_477728 [Botryobasidium botryosum FD-172 SS1]|uniref:Uncharacterized protein n=1 Tax=Botryobasidium botryosum (strain FD-172 SS1) TaxID=930990 RepID=A0A067N549_BOTB1|nr:hypothetical protein BOTBODRAFT_477728 [Botryobasidium botryosum FD-172 SS1]